MVSFKSHAHRRLFYNPVVRFNVVKEICTFHWSQRLAADGLGKIVLLSYRRRLTLFR